MNITGENIPFTLLIRNVQESDSYPTYFIPNEMILGMSESFSPLYFYTDIKPNSEGEVFINYKKGGNIVYSKIKY